MNPLRDAVGQPIEVGDFVVYAAGSRTAGHSGRIARVIETKKKVKVEFHNGDGTPRPPKQMSTVVRADGSTHTWTINKHEWLAPESLVVVTDFKTWRPRP